MKPGGLNHPKLKRLARRLGISIPAAVGHLEYLFAFTSQYAMRGDIGRFSDEEIAEAALWETKPETFVRGLVGLFMDEHVAHRYVVHDWPDHAPDYTKKKIKNAGLGWACDDLEPQQETSGEIQKDPGFPSLPSPSLPSPTTPPKPAARGGWKPVPVAGWALPIFDRVNETLALYDVGRIDACRPGSAREGRWKLIQKSYAGGNIQEAGDLIVKAIHGYVCRHGCEDREDYDAKRHLQIDSILRQSHFDENLTACTQAIERGWSKPFKRGAHTRNPPRRSKGNGEARRPVETLQLPPTQEEIAEAQAATDELRKKLGAKPRSHRGTTS